MDRVSESQAYQDFSNIHILLYLPGSYDGIVDVCLITPRNS